MGRVLRVLFALGLDVDVRSRAAPTPGSGVVENTDELRVWWGPELVGTLRRDAQGRMGFGYDERRLRNRGEAVSASLPPRPEPFEPGALLAHRFFANLLPEGSARASIVRLLRIADTDFDLLRAIGDECAGALSILVDGRVPANDARYRELDGPAFERMVRTRGLLPGEGSRGRRPRLSLAGAQDKVALHRSGDAWFEPLDGAPSTHILKFESPGFANVLVYEAFLTDVARRIGLPVVDVELGRIGSEARHWRAFADACDVGQRFMLEVVRRTLEATMESVARARTEFERRHGPTPALQRVQRVIATQSRRLGQGLA